MAHTAHHLHEQFEPRPDVQALAGNAKGEVNYEPRPEKSIEISSEHKKIMQTIINLYGGNASETDMQGKDPYPDHRKILTAVVYDKDAIYDDPFSYCDTRYKIAGQWYGLPMVCSAESHQLEVKQTPVLMNATGIQQPTHPQD